jgi:hypothetical protein
MIMKTTKFQTCERRVHGESAAYARARFFLAIVLLVMAMNTVAEADCWEDYIKQVDRNTLVMESDDIYRVVPQDQLTVAFWRPPAHLTICDSISDVGTLTGYYQIRNWDWAVAVWATREG